MMPRLQAEQQLLAIEAASAPHMKEHTLQRMTGRYQRAAKGGRERRPSLSEALGGAPMLEVVREPKEPNA